jgi:hypothetical protein
MSKYKIEGTDIDEYFNTGNSVIDNNARYINFPNYDPATEEYQKITSNIGYTIGGIDISDLYNIKSQFQEVSTTSSTYNGNITIPTWAKGAKVFLGTMQGNKGNDTQKAPNGNKGANRGPFSRGAQGDKGPNGNNGHANDCPTGQAKRSKNGGPGGPGGDGGDPGDSASGGNGGTGGNGATGGTGGDGIRYASPNIIDLDSIRGNGISYSVSANAVSLNSANFNYSANRGVVGNNANNPNAGQDGNDAKGGSNGNKGGQGNKGSDGGNGCQDAGTASGGNKGSKGNKGANATPGNNGANGNNGNNGNKGANANVSITGPSDLNAESYSTNSLTKNNVIVHFFID